MNKKNFERYSAALKSGEPLSYTIEVADAKLGIFKQMVDDYVVIMKFDEYFAKKRPSADLKYLAIGAMGRNIEVIVTAIDEKAKTIQVSHSEVAVKKEEAVRAEIDKGIANGKPVIKKARLFYVFGKGVTSGALVDIIGTGRVGLIWCHDWSTEYTPNIADVSRIGDVFDVAIIGKNDSNAQADYKCSRAAAMSDPWVGISKIYQVGDVVIAKCLDVWHEGFCGRLAGTPEFNVRIARPSPKMAIYPGNTYVCEVTKISETSKKFEVKAIRVLNEANDKEKEVFQKGSGIRS